MEIWAIHSAHKRGFQEAKSEYELVQIQREQETAQWKEAVRLKQETELTAIAASYAVLQAQSIQTERRNYEKLEIIAQTASDIYRRDCLDTRGLLQLNQAIKQGR